MNTAKQTLVIGLDGSPRTPQVLEAGRIMAERLNANVVLVSVIEGLEYRGVLPAELAAWSDPTPWLELEKELKRTLDEARERFPAGSVLATRIERGQPWRALCDIARAHKAALIVIGAHGYRPLERFAGTTASRVANRAESSVLIVRQPSEAAAPVGFEHLLVAHDGSERSPQVLESAISLATPSAGRVTLVRALNVAAPISARIAELRPADIERALIDMGRAALNEVRATMPDRLSSDVEARVGFPWEVITDVAKDKEASLIVIGSHGFSGADRVLGTVAGRVVNTADRSVLVVRGAGGK